MQSERETEMAEKHVNIITALKEDGKKLKEKLQNNLEMQKLLEIILKGKQLLKDNQTIVEEREAKIVEQTATIKKQEQGIAKLNKVLKKTV